MKITVQDRDYYYDTMWMKTSIRGGMFSIRFESKDTGDEGSNLSDYENRSSGYDWGHLTIAQAKKLSTALGEFIVSQTIVETRNRGYLDDIRRIRD